MSSAPNNAASADFAPTASARAAPVAVAAPVAAAAPAAEDQSSLSVAITQTLEVCF